MKSDRVTKRGIRRGFGNEAQTMRYGLSLSKRRERGKLLEID